MQINTTTAAKHYKDLVDFLAILTDGTARLAALELDLQNEYIEAVDERREDYAAIQEAIGKAETVIRDLALQHPEWFAEAKTITTPYGKVQSRTSTKLEIANEDVTLALLKQLGPDSAPFIRTTEEINREALEALPDDELARIRVKRVTAENVTITPHKPNLGKAVKQAAKQAAAK